LRAYEVKNLVSSLSFSQMQLVPLQRGQRTTVDYDEEDRYGAVMGTGAASGGQHASKTTKVGGLYTS
jgi:hypothetical protein